jgi:5-methylcytosine-specific restriction protein A
MFERGHVYRRRELHLAYGSDVRVQAQGGILTPRAQPFILVITGPQGQRHGYRDFWDESGVLNYFGAGQYGDMQWTSPNRQLRDHAELGKDVHVFEEVVGVVGGLRYRGQFVGAGYYEEDDVPDTAGEPRRAFVFPSTSEDQRWAMDIDALRERAARTVGRQPKSREGKRRTWERSHDLKIYVRRRAEGACEGCSKPARFIDKKSRPYLEPHHTRRLTDGGVDDYHHVIALCPTCHRRVHQGVDGSDYNEQLKAILASVEPRDTAELTGAPTVVVSGGRERSES